MAKHLAVVESFVERADDIQSSEALDRVLGDCARGLGFTFYSYVTAKICGEDATTTPAPITTGSYPEEWLTRYKKCDYNYIDPVLATGRNSRSLYDWGGAAFTRRQPRRYHRMINEAREFGICRGVTMPIHGPNGESGYFSASLDDRVEPFHDVVCESALQLSILGRLAHDLVIERFALRSDEAAVPLTNRERECLLWVGEGKTAWETGTIIGCSVATVNFHLQNAARKLRVSGKFNAFLKARKRHLLD